MATPTIVWYFIPADDDDEAHPNAYPINRSQKDVRLGDIRAVSKRSPPWDVSFFFFFFSAYGDREVFAKLRRARIVLARCARLLARVS